MLSSMYFRLIIVTLERFGDVFLTKDIELFFDNRYRGITVESNPITAVLLSVLTHPNDYRGIYFIYFNSNSNTVQSARLSLIPSPSFSDVTLVSNVIRIYLLLNKCNEYLHRHTRYIYI